MKTIRALSRSDRRAIQNSSALRASLTSNSFKLFFELYFAHYVTSPMAPFHDEMFRLLEDDSVRFSVFMAFRGSGKSTIVNTALPLWSVLGRRQCKFVVIVALTQAQAKLYMRNLQEEILGNDFLRKDLGPFQEDGDESNSSSIVLSKSGARIAVISVDQSVRGMRHGSHRPDLIVADDVEDLQSTKTRDSRDKLFEWFTKELIPLGNPKTVRMCLVGNMLHRDSLLMRLRDRIESGAKSGVFRRYPILDEQGVPLWSERYSLEDIESLKRDIGSEVAWRTEYMLEDAWAEGQVVDPDWIRWYDEFPEPALDEEGPGYYRPTQLPKPAKLVTGVDLAISERESADYTAFVTGYVWGKFKHKMIFVTDAFAKRMSFSDTASALGAYYSVQSSAHPVHPNGHEVVVETVGYQEAMVQYLRTDHADMKVIGKKPVGSKRERLLLLTTLMREWRILFPKTEAGRMLVEQLLGFGKEPHDDLVDAFTLMANKVFEDQDQCYFYGSF